MAAITKREGWIYVCIAESEDRKMRKVEVKPQESTSYRTQTLSRRKNSSTTREGIVFLDGERLDLRVNLEWERSRDMKIVPEGTKREKRQPCWNGAPSIEIGGVTCQTRDLWHIAHEMSSSRGELVNTISRVQIAPGSRIRDSVIQSWDQEERKR